MGKNSRLETWLHYRVRVTISDTRYFVGTFLSYDRHMNVVLADAEEYRKVKDKETDFKEIKRVVGLIMIRGENIVSFTAEQAPINRKTPNTVLNKGIATGRGVPLNNYVPMQPHYNPHLGNPLGNMPTGVGLHTVTGKPLAPPAHSGFRPLNTLPGNMNNARPLVPGMPPIPQPPMNQRLMGQPPIGQPLIGQPPVNPPPINPPPMNPPPMNPPSMNPPPMNPPPMNPPPINPPPINPPPMNPPPINPSSVNPPSVGQPPIPDVSNMPPIIPPHLPFPPNAKPPTD